MKVELQVLAATSIKRKKPWPRLAFLGQEQESLFLLDKQRVSVLYVPSGKTKRRISALDPLLQNTTSLHTSNNGCFLVGLLTSGDAYLWHKDSNSLKFLQGMESLAHRGEINVPACQKPSIWIADDGRRMVAVTAGYSQTLIWEAAQQQNILAPDTNQVQGTWSEVEVPSGVILPDKACFDAVADVRFCLKECLGECSLCSFVFYHGSQVCVSTLAAKWLESQQIYSYRQPTYQAEWSSKLHPLTSIDPKAQPTSDPGAFVVAYSNDGQFLAIASNQSHLQSCKMIYLAPCHGVVVCADLRALGAKGHISPDSTKSYWITDVSWTYDDLYVICINGQGMAGLLTRLGEPLLTTTIGFSPEMGPRFFLPLHPLMTVQTNAHSSPEDSQTQHFSVACHHSRPILVTSDGFMVTVLRYSDSTNCLSLMTSLNAESVRHLRRVREVQNKGSSMFDSVKKQSQHAMRRKQGARSRGIHFELESDSSIPEEYKFEEPGDDALDGTLDKPLGHKGSQSTLSIASNVPNGRITFGDDENLNTTLDYSRYASEEGLSTAEHLDRANRALFSAWALAVSHTGVWTIHHEESLSNVTHNLTRLLHLLLNSKPSVLKELEALTGLKNRPKTSKKMRGLKKVLHIFTSLLDLVPLDDLHKNAQVCIFDLIHSVINLLASSASPEEVQPRAHTLQGCYALLRHSEVVLQRAYDPQGGCLLSNSDPYAPRDCTNITNQDLFHPSMMSAMSEGDTPRSHSSDQTLVKQAIDENQNAASPKERSGSQLESSIVSRLGRTWVYLYRQCMQQYKSLLKQCLQQPGLAPSQESANQQKALLTSSRHILQLLYTLQCRLHSLQQDLPRREKKHRIKKGDRLCIEGTPSPAEISWLQYIEATSDHDMASHSVGRLLHGTLYSYLLQDDLCSALELVELVARQGDPRKGAALAKQDRRSRQSMLALLLEVPTNDRLQPPAILENPVVRHLVVTLARIMSRYFSNGKLFVYPPHQPFRIPPLHIEYSAEHRTVPLYHDDISLAVRQSQLASAWTPERALHYLLVGGAIVEGAWLLHALGDWKAAFILGSACLHHQSLFPTLYERKKKLLLPENLHPASILKQQLQQIVPNQSDSPNSHLLVTEESDLDHLTSTLSDLLTATCFCNLDITTWLLDTFISRLKGMVSQMKPVVPSGLYLPAPPVYCPQPATASQENLEADAMEEIQLRRAASSLMILICQVMSASHTAIPAVTWYCQRVLEALSSTMKPQKRKENQPLMMDIEFLQETYLQGSSAFHGHEGWNSVKSVLVCLRDLCTVSWMLYVRDNLSLGLRKKAKLAGERMEKLGLAETSDSVWLKHCKATLNWCKLLMPFSKFFSDGTEVSHVLLSLVVELPPTTEMARVMAEHFHDLDSHDPEIQDKVTHILNDWKGVMAGDEKAVPDDSSDIQSARGVSLSVYYHSKAKTVNKLFRQRQRAFGHYEHFIFSETPKPSLEQNGMLHVGSRVFESTQEYLQFLDTLFAVSFHRLTEADSDKPVLSHLPLIVEFSPKIRARESRLLSRKDSMTGKKSAGSGVKGQSVLVIQSPRDVPPMSPRRQVHPKTSTPLPKGPSKKAGLFRSRSMSEVKNKIISVGLHHRSSSDEDVSVGGSPSRKSFRLDLEGIVDEEDVPEGDPLASPLVPQWKLDCMVFGKDYADIEQRLEWLNIWASKNHTLFPGAKGVDDAGGALRCAMKLRSSPRLITYALWLLENCHYKGAFSPDFPEVTVVTVHQTGVTSHNGAASPVTPFTASSPVIESPGLSGIQPLPVSEESPSKKKEKKQKKKDKKKMAEADREVEELEITQEVTVQAREIAVAEVVEAYDAKNISVSAPKKLSFYLPAEEKAERKAESNPDHMTDTEGTLDLSSFGEEELRRTLRVSVMKAQEEMKLEELHVSTRDAAISPVQTASPPSTLVDQAMNTTLHFGPSQDFPNDRRMQPNELESLPRTSNTEVVGEVKDIVRQELRRIMEAQHRGIVAMLGALDEDHQQSTVQPAPPTSGMANIEQQLSDIHLNDHALSTPSGSALTLPDLARDNAFSHGPSQHNFHGIEEALCDLQFLKSQQEKETKRRKKKKKGRQDKENHLAPSFQVKPQPDYSQDHPYAGLMEALREMNYDLTGQSSSAVSNGLSDPPVLLRHNSFEPNSYRLPVIPMPVREAWSGEPSQQSSVPRMPLLQMNQTPSPSFWHQIPERDTDGQKPSVGPNQQALTFETPFPLLHLPGEEHLYADTFHGMLPQRSYHNNVPHDDIMEYQQRKLAEAQSNQQQLDEVLRQELNKRAMRETHKPSSHVREKRRRDKPSKEGKKVKLRKKKNGDESEDGLESLPLDTLPDSLAPLSEEASLRASKDQSATEHATQPPVLHHGYALTPGLCDEYLAKENEVDLLHGTPSSVHYHAAMKLKEEPQKSVLKKDMWTETDKEMAEKAASASEDMAPISTQKHYRGNSVEPGSILPPDVFLGLRFAEQATVPDKPENEGRAFINVVDIGTEILDDIPSRNKSPKRSSHGEPSPRQVKFQSRQPAHREGSPEEDVMDDFIPGPDPTTERLLAYSRPHPSSMALPSEGDMIRNKRYRTKDDIKKRLKDMNSQFNAIECLQKNIEDDFKASKLLVHTIEQFGEALYPERTEPTASVLQHLDKLDADQVSPHSKGSSTSRSPKDNKVEPPLTESLESPRQSTKQKKTPRQEVGTSKESGGLDVSGLSGVSDIVGEIIARGSMDLKDVGLTPRDAQKLIERAIESQREGVRLSNDQLRSFLQEAAKSPRAAPSGATKAPKRTNEERRELQEWMQEKRRERSKVFKKKLTELREHEKHPFKAPGPGTVSLHELLTADKERESRKKVQGLEYEERRKQEASKLMAEILTDHLDLPPPVKERGTQRSRVKKTTTVHKKGKSRSPVTPRSRSLPRKISMIDQRMVSPSRTAMDTSEFGRTWVNVGGERRPNQPETGTPRSVRSEPGRKEKKSNVVHVPPMDKPFTEIVRLQRPESTRPKQNRPAPKTYTERLMETKGEGSSSSGHPTPMSVADRQRLQGSRHLQTPKSEPHPRVVKSYTERLHDMKHTRTVQTGPSRSKFKEEKDTRVMRGGRLTELKRAAITPCKPRKTLTYSEQLRQLQPPKEMYRTGTGTMSLRTGRKWHKAPHKPKTYVEQLRELQQPLSTSREGGLIMRGQPHTGVRRSRPYTDPYVEVDPDDVSVVSSWNVDHNIQQLLHDADGNSYLATVSGTEGTDLDISELQELAALPLDDPDMDDLQYIGDEDYTEMVDLQQIADAASLGGSSIMSFIDWDQVNELIADVY